MVMMAAPFLAGAGSIGGTMAAGTAGAGGAMFGGLFSASNLFPAAMGAGIGMSALQAFGGSSGGYAPMFKVPLSPEGKKLKTSLYEKTKQQWETGLLPENLASIYMGKVKREVGKVSQQARGFLTSMAGGRTRGGTQIKALLTGAESEMQGAAAPAEWKAGQREEEIRNAMKMMENIRNIEMQTPMLQAQASMYKDIMGKGRRATQGQALGDIARWAAMAKVYG